MNHISKGFSKEINERLGIGDVSIKIALIENFVYLQCETRYCRHTIFFTAIK